MQHFGGFRGAGAWLEVVAPAVDTRCLFPPRQQGTPGCRGGIARGASKAAQFSRPLGLPRAISVYPAELTPETSAWETRGTSNERE